MNKKLRYVSDIMFAYFHQQKCGDAENGDYLGGLSRGHLTCSFNRDNRYESTRYLSDIKIHFALREPHSKLTRPSDTNKLLVVTYAWDGNALPGFRTVYFN